MGLYIIGNFPSNYVISKYGTYYPIIIAAILNVLSAWIKCLINYSIYFIYLGMFLSGI